MPQPSFGASDPLFAIRQRVGARGNQGLAGGRRHFAVDPRQFRVSGPLHLNPIDPKLWQVLNKPCGFLLFHHPGVSTGFYTCKPADYLL